MMNSGKSLLSGFFPASSETATPSHSEPDQTDSYPLKIAQEEHHIDSNLICKRATGVIKQLVDNGYEAYLVGGAVRDLMLGMRPKDFDIATNARPEQVRDLFPSCRLIGRRFRLAHIYFGRQYLEVATFRAPPEHSQKSVKITRKSSEKEKNRSQGIKSDDGRIIQDNVYGTLDQDVWRRDFSVNALLYDVHTHEVIDYVGGVADLRNRTLRIIGNVEERYREDPVRMLRAIRFAAKLNLSIDPATQQAIPEMGQLLADVSPARLFDEVVKLLHGGKAEATLDQLREYGLFTHLFPTTEAQLQQGDELFEAFIRSALRNTDTRIRSGKSVTPAFLFAVMLWRDAERMSASLREEGCPNLQSYHIAATEIFKQQAKFTAIPKRNTVTTRDIWALQVRFEFKDCRRAKTFITHPRFRAAYDFMCLRAKAEASEYLTSLCDWWTEFQVADETQQQVMCQNERSGTKKRRKKRRN